MVRYRLALVIFLWRLRKQYLSGISSSEATKEFLPLTLLLLNTTGPVLANSVDPCQLATEEAN